MLILSLGVARRAATDRRRGAGAPPRTPPIYRPNPRVRQSAQTKM